MAKEKRIVLLKASRLCSRCLRNPTGVGSAGAEAAIANMVSGRGWRLQDLQPHSHAQPTAVRQKEELNPKKTCRSKAELLLFTVSQTGAAHASSSTRSTVKNRTKNHADQKQNWLVSSASLHALSDWSARNGPKRRAEQTHLRPTAGY